MSTISNTLPTTRGELKKTGYKSRSVKDELRENLIACLQKKENPFPGIIGYDYTVVPDLQKAILAGHNINLLGLRGQAKTRLARQMVNLLDEFVPVIKGSVLNEDPFNPISAWGKKEVAEKGDALEITWWPREERYTEKLATPDVSVADLIGDIDPIKAARLKLSFSDEEVMHYGLIPRANRGIFVINELPDLQARIQVSLFNILQEGDIQIRGFKLRLLLDIQFVFTANPEDYTHRGSIVTPLKDRIESQIVTHYPLTVGDARKITAQEARVRKGQEQIQVSELVKDILEQISFEARKSEYVDTKSGVSARLAISAYEALLAAAERRMLLNGETTTHARITDVMGVIQAINGKVELVYEGEQEGQQSVAALLIGKAIRAVFPAYFINPERIKRKKETNPYAALIEWFGQNNEVEIPAVASGAEYEKQLIQIPGLSEMAKKALPGLSNDENLILMEFLLYGLAEFSQISRHWVDDSTRFKDLFNSMFQMEDDESDLA